MPSLSKLFNDFKKKYPLTRLDKYIADVEKGYPTTRYPKTISKVQDKIVGWKTDGRLESCDRVGISLGQVDVQHAHGDCLVLAQDALQACCQVTGMSPVLIPRNALTVSYANGRNWKVGNSCQEFVPVNMELKKEGFFTYRMLSKHIQATFYNCDGAEYLAGICYYLQLHGSRVITADIDERVVSNIVGSSDPYPQSNRYEQEIWIYYGAYGRYCKTAGKRVCVFLRDRNMVHMLINLHTGYPEYEECDECRKEFVTTFTCYKLEVEKMEKEEEEEKLALTLTPDQETVAEKEKNEEDEIEEEEVEENEENEPAPSPASASDDDFEVINASN